MKLLLGLLLLVGVAVGGLYYSGTFNFDPVAQAEKARAAINPGMDFAQVAAAAGEPRKWQLYVQEKGEFRPGPAMQYSEANVAQRVEDGAMPGGFAFRYDFHGGSGGAFTVKFDAYGAVEYVADAINMGKLLE